MSEKTHWEEKPKDAGDELVSGAEETISESDRKAAFYDDALESFRKQIQAAEAVGNTEEVDRLGRELDKLKDEVWRNHVFYGEKEYDFAESLEKVRATKAREAVAEAPLPAPRPPEYLKPLLVEKSLGESAKDFLGKLYAGVKRFDIASRIKMMFGSQLYAWHGAEADRLSESLARLDQSISAKKQKGVEDGKRLAEIAGQMGGRLPKEAEEQAVKDRATLEAELGSLSDVRDELQKQLDYRSGKKASYESMRRESLEAAERHIREKLIPLDKEIAEFENKARDLDRAIEAQVQLRNANSERFKRLEAEAGAAASLAEKKALEAELGAVFEELRKSDVAVARFKRERFVLANRFPDIQNKAQPWRDQLRAIQEQVAKASSGGAGGARAEAPKPADVKAGDASSERGERTFSPARYFEEWNRLFGPELKIDQATFFETVGIPLKEELTLNELESVMRMYVSGLARDKKLDSGYLRNLLPQRLETVKFNLERGL